MGPRASVIIPAFNLARYLPAAIDSALAQDLTGPVEVIVVDDGSTDDTPRVLSRYADRVTTIRQPNRGLVAAVDCGLAAVSGEYIALLDADDEWPADRLGRHIEILDANPALGLVHGDMEVIDEHGHVVHPSFFEMQRLQPTDGRVLGRLLGGNFISGGASTFRASLLPAIHPIAPDAAYPDWWIAAGVAAVAEITHDSAIANRYRYHGDNMSLGSGPERQPAIQRLEVGWRRWMMRHLLEDDSVTLEDIRNALGAWRYGLIAATFGASRPARELVERDPDAAAAVLAASPTPSAKTLFAALACDPFDGAIAVDLDVALMREGALPNPVPAPPLIALEARANLTLAWLDEITANPGLLHAFARDSVQTPGEQTLAVLIPRGGDVSALVAIAQSDELIRDERCDVTAIDAPVTTPAKALLSARAAYRLTAVSSPDPYSSLPVHASASAAGV